MAYYDDCIIFLLAKAYQMAHGDFRRRLQPYGLTPIQHLILEVLWEEEGVSAGEIGKRLVLDSATLSGVVERLANHGWITKAPNEDDKRSHLLFPTDKARKLKDDLLGEQEETNQKVLGKVSDAERLLLIRILKDMQKEGGRNP